MNNDRLVYVKMRGNFARRGGGTGAGSVECWVILWSFDEECFFIKNEEVQIEWNLFSGTGPLQSAVSYSDDIGIFRPGTKTPNLGCTVQKLSSRAFVPYILRHSFALARCHPSESRISVVGT